MNDMKISISGFRCVVGVYELPDSTHPFPRLALMDFLPQYESDVKRFKQWIHENRQDAQEVREHQEWIDDLESKIESIKRMLKLDSETPRNKDKIRQLYHEYQIKNPKG